MAEATLSSKNQIVVPREAREALGVSPGDKLLVVVRGKTVVILPRPRSWTKALGGLAKQTYPEGYLDKERASWD
jgi:AbrB family looped-hinge helix DNA binding protein